MRSRRLLCILLVVLLLAAMLPVSVSALETGFWGTEGNDEHFQFYLDYDDIVWDAYITAGDVPGMGLSVANDCTVSLTGVPTAAGTYLVNVVVETQRSGDLYYAIHVTIDPAPEEEEEDATLPEEGGEEPTEAPATEPAPVVSGTPTITKHPYDESVLKGESASFVAYANDAKQYVWELLTVDGGTISCSELAGTISGLGVSGYNSAELVLTNIPLALDGCKVRCRFVGTEESVYSYYATITVTEEVKETTAPTQAPTQAAAATESTEATDPTQQTNAEKGGSTKDKASKGGKKGSATKGESEDGGGSPVLIIAIVVAVVAAAAAAAFVILKKKGIFPPAKKQE